MTRVGYYFVVLRRTWFAGVLIVCKGMKFLAISLALGSFAIGTLYWIGRFQIGAAHAGPHHTHGVVFFALGLLSLVWLRFQTSAPSPSGVR